MTQLLSPETLEEISERINNPVGRGRLFYYEVRPLLQHIKALNEQLEDQKQSARNARASAEAYTIEIAAARDEIARLNRRVGQLENLRIEDLQVIAALHQRESDVEANDEQRGQNQRLCEQIRSLTAEREHLENLRSEHLHTIQALEDKCFRLKTELSRGRETEQQANDGE